MEWGKQVDEVTQKFLETFGSLSTEQLNFKPNAKAWSIAQNIEHLIVVNQSYFKVIEDATLGNQQPPFTARIKFIVNYFGKTILKWVGPDRRRKMKTFSIWDPAQSEVPAGVMDRFEAQQKQLGKMMENSRELIKQGVVISSPANKYIVYKLEKAFEIIIAHEHRHFEQAKDVYAQL